MHNYKYVTTLFKRKNPVYIKCLLLSKNINAFFLLT